LKTAAGGAAAAYCRPEDEPKAYQAGGQPFVPDELLGPILARMRAKAAEGAARPLVLPAAPRCAPPEKPSPRERAAREGVFALRARLRRVAPSRRERGCGALVVEHVDTEPTIELRQEAGQVRAHWKGLMQCGHIWTCPACSRRLRTERGKRVEAAVNGLGKRWQMVTVTLRHHDAMALAVSLPALSKAWRRTRQGGKVQRIWSERVSASVRAVEVTHGRNGWHPHVHVLLRTTEWTDEEKDALLARWQDAITDELGKVGRPDALHAITWSEPFDGDDAKGRALYVAKLGLEISGAGKLGRKGSRSHWQVAEDAANGDERSRLLWHEFYTATKGKRALELDDRAQAAAEKFMQQDPKEGSGEPMGSIRVLRDDVRALRYEEKFTRRIFAEVLEAAETQGEAGVRWYVNFARARMKHDAERFAERQHDPWR